MTFRRPWTVVPSLLLAGATLASADTVLLETTVFLKTDDLGRVQVSVVESDDRIVSYLFHPEARLPKLEPVTLRAMVTEGDRRLLVDGVDRPFHVDLYLAGEGTPPAVAGDWPTLRASGISLAKFAHSQTDRALERIDLGDHLIVWNPDLVSTRGYGEYTTLGDGDITCIDHKVIRDTSCTKGGPGTLYMGGFKCPRVRTQLMGAMFEIEGETALGIQCASGWYPCGACVHGAALEACKPGWC